jgi:hypothetical protein
MKNPVPMSKRYVFEWSLSVCSLLTVVAQGGTSNPLSNTKMRGAITKIWKKAGKVGKPMDTPVAWGDDEFSTTEDGSPAPT